MNKFLSGVLLISLFTIAQQSPSAIYFSTHSEHIYDHDRTVANPLSAMAATTWAPHDVVCPICKTTNTFMQPMSYGNYIYGWSSKYQYIFWPLTDSPVLYSCKKCHLTTFMWDFEDLPKDKLPALERMLKGLTFSGSFEKYTDIPMSQRLLIAEQVYATLGQDEDAWCRFYRVKGYHFAEEKRQAEADDARRRALGIAEKQLTMKENAGRSKELLLITGAMRYFLKDEQGALKNFDQALKLKYEDAKLEPEKVANIDEYLTGLLNDYIATIRDEQKARTEPVWPHRTLEDHDAWIAAIAASPTSHQMVSGDYNGKIVVWDAQTGTKQQTLPERNVVMALAFAPDGGTFASGGYNKTVDLWDSQTGEMIRELIGHKEYVSAIAFSTDGAIIASGSWDDTLKLWDAKTGRELRTIKHDESVWDVSFSPGGKTIATADFKGVIRLWDANTGKPQRTLAQKEGDGVVLFSPDGKILATVDKGDAVMLWDATTGKLLRRLTGVETRAIAFSPDSARLVSAGWDGRVMLWDVQAGKLLETLTKRGGRMRAVAFTNDGESVVTGSDDHALRIWDVRPGTKPVTPITAVQQLNR